MRFPEVMKVEEIIVDERNVHFLDEVLVVEIPDVVDVAECEVVVLDDLVDEGLVRGLGDDGFAPVVWVALSRELHFAIHENI